ncbi:ALF repeat-containing protein, partial [Kitasatospora nipponensis]|uniref:ALF repeat-containing protein n=1 Tax=Kitasatospora nipponensis TaxID=258049 RepID=UPI003CD06B7F
MDLITALTTALDQGSDVPPPPLISFDSEGSRPVPSAWSLLCRLGGAGISLSCALFLPRHESSCGRFVRDHRASETRQLTKDCPLSDPLFGEVAGQVVRRSVAAPRSVERFPGRRQRGPAAGGGTSVPEFRMGLQTAMSMSSIARTRRRWAVGLVAGSLLTGLLAIPAAADDTTPATAPNADRVKVVAAWQAGGSAVRQAAESALTGSPADLT